MREIVRPMASGGRKILALLLAAALLVLPAGCGGGGSSSPEPSSSPSGQGESLQLLRSRGEAGVESSGGSPVALELPLVLEGGDRITTGWEGSAWISRGETLSLRLEGSTRLEVSSQEKTRRVELEAGGLFFRGTGAGEEDFTIVTPSLRVKVRGGCGWVMAEDTRTDVSVLEGSVECSGSAAAMVHAGEAFTSDNRSSPLTAEMLPAFVLEELEADPQLAEAVEKACGFRLQSAPGGDPGALNTIRYVGEAEASTMTAEQAGELADVLEHWKEAMETQAPEIMDVPLLCSAVLFDAGQGSPALVAASNAPYPCSNITLCWFREGVLQTLERETITAVGLQKGYLALCGYQLPDGTVSDLYNAWVCSLEEEGIGGEPCTWGDLDEWATGQAHIDGREVTSDAFGEWLDRWVLEAPCGFSTGNGGSGMSWGTVPADAVLGVLRDWGA